MNGNTFGTVFQLTTFGESHGKAIGGIITGIPAGLAVDEAFLQAELDRRRPGQSAITTQRSETDTLQLLSGIFEGKTLGTPIGFLIPNNDQKAEDYDHLRDAYRPSHADMTYTAKYGIRDHRGGGRASARETACRVAGGAFAKLLLRKQGITMHAYVSQVGNVAVGKAYAELDLSLTESSIVRCPDPETAEKMIALIDAARAEGDSLGGIVTGVIRGVPAGLGAPVFNKLHAALGAAMLGINAVKGFDYGLGFEGVHRRGSEVNDLFVQDEKSVKTLTNHSGGIQGGISNGMDIFFRVAFKPTATISKPQQSVNSGGETVMLEGKGRHDPCVLPRAVPVVEAMAALVLADHMLISANDRFHE